MPRRALLSILLALACAAPCPAAPLALPVHARGSGYAGPCYAADVIEVQLAPAASRIAHPASAGPTRAGAVTHLGVARLDATATRLGATLEPEFAGELPPAREGERDFTAFHVVHLPAGVAIDDALREFRALPEVASAWPLAILPVSSVPNDSLFSTQYWLYGTSSPRHDIRATEAWSVCAGDTAVIVAILDTGVLANHPDLSGTTPGLTGNLWVNRAEKGGVAGVDDDGNGFADDTWGWDFVTGGRTGDLFGATGEDVNDPDNDPNDFAGHGTMVAGIIGALTNNVHGIAGVAPTVRMMPVRVGWLPLGSPRPNGVVRMDFVAQGLRYAARSGAKVINCSFSSDYTAGLDSAVTAAVAAGATIVVASGNYTQANYLATRSDVIAVGATDAGDAYWAGTETGPWLDIVAPGVAMNTTMVTTTSSDSVGYRQPTYTYNVTGTSVAAPVVAGVAALLDARMLALGQSPLLGASMRQRLRDTGDDVSAWNPGQPYLVPRVNAYRALADPGLTGVAPGAFARGWSLAPRTQPSRGVVTLDWSAGAGAGPRVLEIADVAGRVFRRATIADGAPAGAWTWDGRDAAGRAAAPGIYFARLAGGAHGATARVVLLR